MSNDIAIQSTFRVPEGSTISTKPAHLIILKEKVGVAKNSHNQCFVSLEQPGMGNAAFVHAKGFFTDATPEEVKTGYKELLANMDKATVSEEYFNWDDVKRITNLVFRHK